MRIAVHWRGGLKSGVLVSLILGCAAASFAQDLGEIARQERERKKEQPTRAEYVYTNDDLQREHILVPEDKERAIAAREGAKPTAQVAQTSAAPVAPAVATATASAPAPSPAQTATRTSSASAVTASAATSQARPSSPAAPIFRPAVATNDSPQVASAKTASDEAKQSPLEAILELVREQETSAREAAAEKHSHERPAMQTTASGTPAGGARLPQHAHQIEWAPVEEKKTLPGEMDASEPSAPVFRSRRRYEASLKEEPIDLGVTDVVTVERGDSLWKLARRYLGSGTRWRELAAVNTQILNANVLHVGEWICLPQGNLQNARRITPRARGPETMTRKVAQKIVPKACAGEANFDRFVVTTAPLGGSLRREWSPGRCTSTP